MGTNPRQKPRRLAEKLARIREGLGLSQSEMIRHLGAEDVLTQNRISDYELGNREPSLPVLLSYARAAGVWVDVLIDDGLDLPARLPSPTKSEGVRRKPASRPKRNKS
jgi:transcriptional regulator with XRE-family HTH domain